MDFKYLYAETRGRISRKVWWLGAIGLAIIAIIVNAILAVAGATTGLSRSTFGLGLIMLISIAVLFWPYYALTLKRLHDRGRPEALFWIFIAPLVLSAALVMMGVTGEMGLAKLFGHSAPAFQPNGLGRSIAVVSAGVKLWALVELGFLKGQSGENAHGPDPLAPRG